MPVMSECAVCVGLGLGNRGSLNEARFATLWFCLYLKLAKKSNPSLATSLLRTSVSDACLLVVGVVHGERSTFLTLAVRMPPMEAVWNPIPDL